MAVSKGTRTLAWDVILDSLTCRSYLNTNMVRHNIICLPFFVKAPNTKHAKEAVTIFHLATKETKL